MSKIRVVQVGTEHDHAAGAATALKGLPETFVMEGIIEEKPELRKRAEKIRDFDGIPYITWEEAFAKRPDAFIIETGEFELVPNATRALEAGYHVHLDKPGSENCDEFHRMCKMAEEKNLVLSFGYMYRHNPAVLYARQLFKEGKLGEIISVEAQMNICYTAPAKRKWLGQFKGGMMYFLGCHIIDLVATFCGFPDEVIPLNSRTMLNGVDSVDYGFAVYRYKHGVSFAKTNATEINGTNRRQLVITGSLGTIEIRPIEEKNEEGFDDTYAKVTLNNDIPWGDNSIKMKFEPHKRYDRMFLYFAKYIRREEKNPYSYEYEAKLHDLIVESCK